MTQLDLVAWRPTATAPAPEPAEDAYAIEWAAFRKAHPGAFEEFLRLCRVELDRGATYLSAKLVWEQLRRWCKADPARTYKLDNNHTRHCADDARAAEPRLVGVMRSRSR